MVFYSHFRNANGSDEGQTVRAHVLRVMAYAGRFAEGIGFSSLAKLVGVLHDAGKLNRAFQDYLEYSYHHPSDHSRRGSIDHAAVGAKYLWEKYYGKNASDMERLTVEWACTVIMSHHTGLCDFVDTRGESPFLERLDKSLEHYEESKRNFLEQVMPEDVLDTLFHDAVREVDALVRRISEITDDRDDMDADFSGDAFSFYRGMAIKFLYSALIDADRLQTAEFMGDLKLERDWDTSALWEGFSRKLEAYVAAFSLPEAEGERRIAKARAAIGKQCLDFASRAPDMYTLGVPTGSGKTLASMRFALTHARMYGKRRIFVILPYVTIIDQNADTIRKVFQLDKNDDVLLEHHASVVDDLPRDESDQAGEAAYDDRTQAKRILTERWDVPLIFTTQVQFLNTLFAGGTKEIRRLHALENSVIIFDEIQTLPVKCTYLFNEAMNFLKDFAHVTAVLCTATQPTLSKLAVPLKKAAQPNMVTGLEGLFEAFRRIKVENRCVSGGHSAETIAAYLYEDAMAYRNVLCIVNTTSDARRLYQSLKARVGETGENMALVYLSTKLCPAHRRKILKQMKDHLSDAHAGRLICVSTQLVEAGVDLSFAVVYRALAGFDSIAQAAGRCNRHGELRLGMVKVFNLQETDLRHLEDIRRGEKIAYGMLDQFSPEEILTPRAMDAYFQAYYQACSHRVKGYETTAKYTLYDALSENAAGDYARQGRPCGGDTLETQAFRSAGREFFVIDNFTVGVLVPYDKGKALRDELNGKIYDKKEVFRKLKEIRPFMVNLFSYEIDALLKKGAIWETENGVIALQDAYYDEKLGVVFDEQKNSFCCF